MHLWGDAEACPQGNTALRCRAAARRQIALTLVAPQPRRRPAFATQGDRRLTRAGRTGPAASG